MWAYTHTRTHINLLFHNMTPALEHVATPVRLTGELTGDTKWQRTPWIGTFILSNPAIIWQCGVQNITAPGIGSKQEMGRFRYSGVARPSNHQNYWGEGESTEEQPTRNRGSLAASRAGFYLVTHLPLCFKSCLKCCWKHKLAGHTKTLFSSSDRLLRCGVICLMFP